MKAVTFEKYGEPEVLKFIDIKKPSPQQDQVLIRVHAISVHFGDTRIRKASPSLVRLVYGFFKPKKNLILGMEVSGTIEEVGSKVVGYKKGDSVLAFMGFKLDGYAEYVCISVKTKNRNIKNEGIISHIPANLTFEEAAVLPAGALTALRNIHKATLKNDSKVLINGASGSLGTYAIQILKYYGAEVTAVCSSENFELVKSLGADKVIDYRNVDFTQQNEKYDVVYDAVMKSSKRKCKGILKAGGIFLNNTGLEPIDESGLSFLISLIERGYLKPVVDKVYTFSEIQQAHKYVDKGHKKGNVAISII